MDSMKIKSVRSANEEAATAGQNHASFAGQLLDDNQSVSKAQAVGLGEDNAGASALAAKMKTQFERDTLQHTTALGMHSGQLKSNDSDQQFMGKVNSLFSNMG
jgi:hypothetical protein